MNWRKKERKTNCGKSLRLFCSSSKGEGFYATLIFQQSRAHSASSLACRSKFNLFHTKGMEGIFPQLQPQTILRPLIDFFLMTNWRIFFYIFCRKYWQTSDSPCASSWSLYFGLLQRSVLQLFLDGWRARITAHLLHQMVQRKRRVFSVSVPMTSETQMPCPEDANPSYNCFTAADGTTISMLLGPRFTLYIPQICPNEQRDMTLELKLNTHLPSMIPKLMLIFSFSRHYSFLISYFPRLL